MNGLRPEGADPAAFPARAGAIADARTEVAQRGVDKAAGEARAVELAQQPAADALNAQIGAGTGASRNIDEMYRATRQAEQQQSRDLYNAPAIAQAEVPVQPLADTAAGVAKQGSAISPIDPVVQKYASRFADLEGNATMADVNRLRAELEADIQGNLVNGNVVSQLRQFKDATAQYADRLAAEGSPAGDAARAASENFATRVQPNFREGAGGRVDATLKSNPNSASVLPSEMAGNFLTRPEDAQDLMRIAGLRGNTEQTAQSARTWLFDQLAQKGVAKNGAIDGEKLALWRNKNSDLVDAIPGLRGEIDGMVRDAKNGTALRQDYAAQLAEAQGKVAQTAKDNELLTSVRGKAPDKAAASIFGSDNPEQAMKDLVSTVGKNPEARDGLKASVADYFAQKVSGVAPQNVSEGTQNINFAQLTKEFTKNEKALAALFSPEEMNNLRAAQKVLAPLAQRAQQATVGSQTAERNESFWRTFEAGAKLYYGMLKGGGITRTAKLVAQQLDDGSNASAERLMALAMFDPKLAKQLLKRDITEKAAPVSNSKVGTILRRGEVLRQQTEE